jgi:hypothetical protein
MELTPCLGIGDLVILKAIDVVNHLNITKIHLSQPLMKTYRQYPDRFQQFITQFIKMLFPGVIVDIVPDHYAHINYQKYNLQSPYIYQYVQLPPKSVPFRDYLVIHTKVRMETKCLDKTVSTLTKKIGKLRTHKTIVILGEKVVENCLEQKALNIVSLYPTLLCLQKHNDVRDLTRDILYSGNPVYDDFVYDLNVIHQADLNVTFGIGGPFGLCQAFSEHNLCYVGETHEYDQLFSHYRGLHRELKPFIKALKQCL